MGGKVQPVAESQGVTLLIELPEDEAEGQALQRWVDGAPVNASGWLPRFYAWPTSEGHGGARQERTGGLPGLVLSYSLVDMLARLQLYGVEACVTTLIINFGNSQARFWDQVGGLMPLERGSHLDTIRYHR